MRDNRFLKRLRKKAKKGRRRTGHSRRRFLDAFIDELDLAGLGFAGVVPEATGRPSYHPATL
jgi:hypothetical protein